MALNDELLTINEKIKYFSLETFNEVPDEPGIYAWFYPLRLKGRELRDFIEDINLVFNFYHDGKEIKESKAVVNMGWKKFSLGTGYKPVSNYSSFIKKWEELYIDSTKTDSSLRDIKELKKVIFISSIFMPPLYIGKAKDLNYRCQQHIMGTSNEKNVFHNRFRNYAAMHKMSCRNVEDLIFACISTKKFNLEGNKYEELIEQILLNLIKPMYSVK
jgi:hypothetical protein